MQSQVLRSLGIIALVLLCFRTEVFAKKAIVPQSLKNVTVLNSKELYDLIKESEAKNETAKLMVVDVRRQLEYFEEHIAGAVLIPYKEASAKSVQYNAKKDSFDLTQIEHSSAEIVVFYCNGPDCWRSYKACVWALKAKIRQKIYWLREGFPVWKAQHFPTAAGKN